MSNEAKLVVEPRTEMGSAACRRLRKRGLVPGNVYGHNADPIAVVVASDVLGLVLKRDPEWSILKFPASKIKRSFAK